MQQATTAEAFLQIILLVGFKEISFLEKDTIFAMGLYLFVLNLINFIYTKKITKKMLFLSIFSGIIISCFRHAGILVAIITFILLIIICLKNNHKKYIKTIIYIIGVILIFVSIFTFVCTKIFHGKMIQKFYRILFQYIKWLHLLIMIIHLAI